MDLDGLDQFTTNRYTVRLANEMKRIPTKLESFVFHRDTARKTPMSGYLWRVFMTLYEQTIFLFFPIIRVSSGHSARNTWSDIFFRIFNLS